MQQIEKNNKMAGLLNPTIPTTTLKVSRQNIALEDSQILGGGVGIKTRMCVVY